MPRPLPELLREAARAVRDQHCLDCADLRELGLDKTTANLICDAFPSVFDGGSYAPSPDYQRATGGRTMGDLALELEDAATRLEAGHG